MAGPDSQSEPLGGLLRSMSPCSPPNLPWGGVGERGFVLELCHFVYPGLSSRKLGDILQRSSPPVGPTHKSGEKGLEVRDKNKNFCLFLY